MPRANTFLRLAELVPSLLIGLALGERGPWRALEPMQVDGRTVQAIAFVDRAGTAHELYLDSQTRRLVRAEHIVHDELFGDDRQRTDYLQTRQLDSLVVASHIRRQRLWFTEEDLECTPAPHPVELSNSTADVAAPPTAALAEPQVERIAEGLYMVRLQHLDNRSAFLDASDHVVAFEAPL